MEDVRLYWTERYTQIHSPNSKASSNWEEELYSKLKIRGDPWFAKFENIDILINIRRLTQNSNKKKNYEYENCLDVPYKKKSTNMKIV